MPSFRIKSGNPSCPQYFKVATDNYQTEIYLVLAENAKLNSIMIFLGKPLSPEEALSFCKKWVADFAAQTFEITN